MQKEIINILSILSSILGPVLATFLGIKTWEKKYLNEAKAKVAKNIMYRIYNIYDNFNFVRNPIIMSNEFLDNYSKNRKLQNNNEEKEKLLYVYQKRIKILLDELEKLEKINNLLIVEFGNKHKKLIIPLKSVINKLIEAINIQIKIWKKETTYEDSSITNKELRELLYYNPILKKRNKLHEEILKAISYYEELLIPYCNLKRPSNKKIKQNLKTIDKEFF